jgi:hypothetical protein
VLQADSNSELLDFCSDTVVAISAVDLPYVINVLMSHFESGILPAPHLLKTLGTVSIRHGAEFLTYLRDIMAKVLPVLGLAKLDRTREVFAECM